MEQKEQMVGLITEMYRKPYKLLLIKLLDKIIKCIDSIIVKIQIKVQNLIKIII
jgi:hypothetical protein